MLVSKGFTMHYEKREKKNPFENRPLQRQKQIHASFVTGGERKKVRVRFHRRFKILILALNHNHRAVHPFPFQTSSQVIIVLNYYVEKLEWVKLSTIKL